MNINNKNIAIVHDWFLKKSLSGSEIVTLLIDDCITKNYSEPDIFSLTSNIISFQINFQKIVIHLRPKETDQSFSQDEASFPKYFYFY